MSSGARSHTVPAADRVAMSLPRLEEMKRNGEPIVMVTAYDYPSATVAEAAGVDLVLVGDSAANVVLGYERTDLVSMDEMIMLGKAVRRGLKTPLMVGDMPMGSYEASNELAVQSAQRMIALARSTEAPPRSSLTASQPASLTNRCAFSIASSFEAS